MQYFVAKVLSKEWNESSLNYIYDVKNINHINGRLHLFDSSDKAHSYIKWLKDNDPRLIEIEYMVMEY